jgi:2-dehydropantoate 2-reductase
MKICIYGAGSIGGYLGARLAARGKNEVSAVARGQTLAALQTHGWRVKTAVGLLQTPVKAVADPRELGVQDLVIIAVKGPALGQVAATIGPLLGPRTVVMPAMNGVPWWFVEGLAGVGSTPLSTVDPGGCIAKAIAIENVVGCVVHMSTSSPEPGLVDHRMGQRLIIGEAFGIVSNRVTAIGDALTQAGFQCEPVDNVREHIWYKLWGNMTMNPVSALTGATIDHILGDPLVTQFCSAAMREASDIGTLIGCRIDEMPEDRHNVTKKLGAFKTSMLQDVQANRPIELDALVAAVREIASRVGVSTPNIDALFGLTRLFAKMHGLYPT